MSERWTIEKHFQFLTQSLHCEVSGLGQPRAALFAFAMALVAGNALAVVRGSLRSAHGAEAEAEVSGYYLADEPGFSFQCLPHIRVERFFRDIAINRHFLVFIALAENAPVALLDFRWFPGSVEVMQRDKPFLDVRASAHLLGAADQHAH